MKPTIGKEIKQPWVTGENKYDSRLSESKKYICLIDGEYEIGEFLKVWFGWNFQSSAGIGVYHQLDGHDGTKWGGIWEIKKPVSARKGKGGRK